MKVAAMLAEQPEQSGPRRSTLCEVCGQGFSVPYKDWHPEGFQYCPSCQEKRNKLALLQMQLASAHKFGHTAPGETCEMCAIQNQIDDVIHNGYDWREDHEARLDNLPQQERGGGE